MYLTSGHLPLLTRTRCFRRWSWSKRKTVRTSAFLRDARVQARHPAEAGAGRRPGDAEKIAHWDKQQAEAAEAIDKLDDALLPQGHELPAPPPHLCGGAAQLPRPAVAPGRIRHLLPLRAIGRAVRPDARALAQHERRAHLLHPGAVRAGVQCRQRDVSQVLQDLRHREIRDALQHPRQGGLGQEIRQRTRAVDSDREHGARRPQELRHQLRRGGERSGLLRAED